MFTSNWVEKNANDYDELISAIKRGDENSVESILDKCSMSGWEAHPLYVAVSCKNEKIKQMMCDHYRKFDRYSLIVLKQIINEWNNFSASDKQIYEMIIYELTSNNNDHISRNNVNGSLLAQACESGQIEIVKVLIKQGTNVNFLGKNFKFLPLHLAILRNQTVVVDELIKAGANVNMSDKDGNRPLHFASESGNVNIVKALLKHGAGLDCKNYNLKCTPLYTAVENGHVAVAEELIKAGANMNMSAKDGKSPLHFASELGNIEIVDILLANEADPDWIIADNKWTPLFLAVEKGHLAVVESLLRAKADVNAVSVDGKTPLYVGLDFNRIDIIRVLLDYGADVHVREDTKKSTLLHTAASYDNDFAIEKLVAMGVDLNARDIFGKTPLHVAAQCGDKAMRSLLSLGADKSLEDHNGKLPFHEAIGNNFEALDILFDVNEAKKSTSFHEFVGDLLKNCYCPSGCFIKSNDAANRLLMHLIKFEAINVRIYDNNKLKLHRIKDNNYYNECLEEAEQLKDFFLIDNNVSLYDFLHMGSKRRLAYVERIPSDLAQYRIYGCLIEDYTNEAVERKSLLEITKKVLYELTDIFMPDICVERISDCLTVENLRNLSNV